MRTGGQRQLSTRYISPASKRGDCLQRSQRRPGIDSRSWVPGTGNDDPARIHDDGGAKKPLLNKSVSAGGGQLIDVVGSDGSGHYGLLTFGLSPVDSPGGNTSGNHTDSQGNYRWKNNPARANHNDPNSEPG